MPRIILLIIGIAVFLFPVLSRAEKRETFQSDDTSGSFGVKNDWFGNIKTTRKTMETEEETKQREAIKAEAARRKAQIEQEEKGLPANEEDLWSRLSPRRAQKYKKEEGERVRAANPANEVPVNAEGPAGQDKNARPPVWPGEKR